MFTFRLANWSSMAFWCSDSARCLAFVCYFEVSATMCSIRQAHRLPVGVGSSLEGFYVWFHLLLSRFLPGGRGILDIDDENAA